MVSACVCKSNLALIVMIQKIIIGFLLFYSAMAQSSENIEKAGLQKDCVILLHGLARTSFSMRKIEAALKGNYHVINNSYPSRKHSIETLADLAIAPALESCGDAPNIHFVTHSLGGILVRQYLSQHSIKNLNNVVMLGPPNNGSELVDYFQSSKLPSWLFDKANGPAGSQLGTDHASSKPIELGAVDFNLGVIAGNVSYSPLFSKALDGEDDGKVSVNSTQIAGMKDHITLPVSHTFMMDNDEVITQVSHFLKNGVFKKTP